MSLADNNKLNIGSGNDMSIYHDGTDSIISNTTGTLKLGTETAGGAITIGNAQSEVTVGDNLTVSGDATVSGNLTVVGEMTTTHATSYTVSDKLIKLGEGNTGTAHDLGIVFTRGGGGSSNISNKSLIWDESNDTFAFAATDTEDGNTNGNVTIDGYAPLRVGSIRSDNASVFSSDVTVSGNLVLGATTVDESALGLINGISAIGSSENSKAVTQSDSGVVTIGATGGNEVLNIASHDEVDGGLKLNNVLVTASANEINLVDGAGAGSIVNGKSVIYGDAGEVNMTTLQIAGSSVTSSVTELNKLTGLNSTTDELNLSAGVTISLQCI